jgi:monoglucosyldiacylglycerol epimerase
MDFNLQLSPFLVQALLGLVSIVGAEVVRDSYHLAGHYWQPLQRWHNLHHKAYRPDLTITNQDLYQKAQWYNDVPESLAMVAASTVALGLTQNPGLWLGVLYSLMFLVPAVARSQGYLLQTDLTHKPGPFLQIPHRWTVNRTYHWRHHFDHPNAYYSGHFTLVDTVLGTSLSLKGKKIGITGASGTMGRALTHELLRAGAQVTALTTQSSAEFASGVQMQTWQLGSEADLLPVLQEIDILVVNHGMNAPGDRSASGLQTAYEVNTFSAVRLTELFLQTVTTSPHKATKEVWVNTSEAEVNPAFSPLYELSKRALGDWLTMRRLDAPCIMRKLVLGPFKSQLNPYGVMSPQWTARAIVALAKRDVRNIIVTINPITYLLFPLKEVGKSLYFRLCTR